MKGCRSGKVFLMPTPKSKFSPCFTVFEVVNRLMGSLLCPNNSRICSSMAAFICPLLFSMSPKTP